MRRELEHQEQVALMDWAALGIGMHPELRLLFAIPNGGARSKATAGKLKAEGVKPGVPDLCLPVARGGFHGLYIELKAGKNTADPAQKQWCADLRAEGYRAEVVRGWTAAAELIVQYLRGTA